MDCKIFISSTFKDMQDERDVIRNEVLPEISDYALNYGVTLDIVDLRWGIKTDECETSDKASVKILKTCFDEITLCKPFFIGIIGERYGWIPNLDSIKEAIDPAFLEDIKLEEKSVTEYEMDFALSTYDMSKASFVFCLRDEINGELNEEEKAIYVSSSKEDKEKIKKLKNKIVNKCKDSCFSYKTSLKEDRHLDLKTFKEELISYLKKEIDKRFEGLVKPKNNIEKEMVYQNALVVNKASYFEGRKLILEDIEKFKKSKENILGIYGVSGIGKSSLIAHLISEDLKRDNIKTIYFLAGVSQESNFVYNMVVSFIYQLSNILNVEFDNNYFDNNYVIENFDDILNKFYLLLSRACLNNSVHIYVDALDQFSFSGENGLLEWLKAYYVNSLANDNLKIIFSYINNSEIEKEIILKNIRTLELNGITNEDIISISNGILKKNKKSVPDKCLELLKNKKDGEMICCSNPLYLSLLLQEIINFDAKDFARIKELQVKENLKDEDAIYTYIYNFISDVPTSLSGEFFALMEKAKDKISKTFIETVFGIIAMSQRGIREKDIFSICSLLGINFESADYSYFKKIFKLFIRENNGYVDFSHKIFDEILEDFYFNQNIEISKKINEKTVEYLAGLSDTDEFKKQEYLYYLKLVDNSDVFSDYLKKNIKDEKVFESFMNVYQMFMGDKEYPDMFFLNVFDNVDNLLDFTNNVIRSEQSSKTTMKILLDLLSVRKELDIHSMIVIYYYLSRIYYYNKDAKIAFYYVNMTNKLLDKEFKKSQKIDDLFKNIYSLYKEICLSNKNIKELLKFIKKWIKYAKKDNDEGLQIYLEKEYISSLRIIKYKKAKKLFYRSNIKDEYEELFFQKDFSKVLAFIKNIGNYEMVFNNREVIELAKRNIISRDQVTQLISLLDGYLEKVSKDMIEKESINLLRISAYFNGQVAQLYLSLANKEESLKRYEISRDINNTITKISDDANDLEYLANSEYMIEKITNNKHKESKKNYKKFYKFNKYTIDLATKNINKLLIVATVLSVAIIFIILPLIIIDNINIFNYLKNMFVYEAFMLYLADASQVFLFIALITFFYQLFDYLDLLNPYEAKSIYIKNKMKLYGAISIVATAIFAYCCNIKSYILVDYLFLGNLVFGALSSTYLLNLIKNAFKFKSSVEKGIEKNIFDKKNKVIKVIKLSALSMCSILSIYLMINIEKFPLFNYVDMNKGILYCVGILNFIATGFATIKVLRGIKKYEIR